VNEQPGEAQAAIQGPTGAMPPEVPCPYCGGKMPRRPVGRPRLQVPVQNIVDAVSAGETVTSVARRFGISRATVYRIKDGAQS
jgi:DNA invertase Pin-like site-specific DNA recombinase